MAAPLRIALVSPRGPLYRHRGGAWRKQMRYAPLTLTTLAALIPDDISAEVALFDEGLGDVPDDLDADLVGISAITGTAPRSYEIADRAAGARRAGRARRRPPDARAGRGPAPRRRGRDGLRRGRVARVVARLPGRADAGALRPGAGPEPGRPSARAPRPASHGARRPAVHAGGHARLPAPLRLLRRPDGVGRPDATARRRGRGRHRAGRGEEAAVPRPQPDRRRRLREGAVPRAGPARRHVGRARDDAHRRRSGVAGARCAERLPGLADRLRVAVGRHAGREPQAVQRHPRDARGELPARDRRRSTTTASRSWAASCSASTPTTPTCSTAPPPSSTTRTWTCPASPS